MTPLSRHAGFGLLAVIIGALNLPTLRQLYALSQQDAAASHLLLVPLVTLALVKVNGATIFAAPRLSPVGVVVLGAGFTLTSVATMLGGSLTAAALGLVVQWVGAFTLMYGPAAVLVGWFPLFVLVFVAPFPPAVLAAATSVLKDGSTEVVSLLFSLTGTAVHREGYVFNLATISIQIADECSGIRSSTALLMTSLLAGHMFLRTSRAKVLLVLAVLPITILKNGIRIVSLSLLAIYVDPSFLIGRLHNDGGIAFFLLALGLCAPVLAMLLRFENRLRLPQARVSSAAISSS
jgi:exosortase